MSYKVTGPLAIVSPADGDESDESGNAGPRYFYEGAVIPDGFNDERCDTLADEGLLEKVKDEKSAKAAPKS